MRINQIIIKLNYHKPNNNNGVGQCANLKISLKDYCP
jgi:hypothetical protein